ncbi:MAG: DUF4097 family beta strand repeat-containing protein [Terracidiphilus sp.]
MSSMPPNMPPGGAPPPYDPRTQWRVYRAQQRAAWRAQRDAWRAQRHAWKWGYGGAYGPRVPSVVGPLILIAIGVVYLLCATGRLSADAFWSWYGQWWPLLLIGAGLALLAEWMLDLSRKAPVRRSGSFVGLLVFLAFIGICAAGFGNRNNWNWMRYQFGDNNFFNHFGQPEHDFDQQVLNTAVPANATVDIEDPRGDVSIAAGDGPNMQVEAHEIAYADSDSKAKSIFKSVAPDATVSGGAVTIRSQSNDNGSLNLTVTVPKTARITVNAGHGDVSATGLTEGIAITAPHGDMRIGSITGPVQVHFAGGKHDFSARQVNGDIVADGNSNDLTFSEIDGRITVNGEIFGEVHAENVSGPIDLHTSVTDIQIASLPGEMTLDSDDLRVVEAKGAVHVVTHDKDVDLTQIYGDSFVQDSTGDIAVSPAGAYGVQAMNGKGDVTLTLPPDASGTVSGQTHNGDIDTDYGFTVSGDENKTVSGTIGSGGPKIVLSADDGDLRIRKGPAFPAQPPAPNAETSEKAPHLKAPKSAHVETVTQ